MKTNIKYNLGLLAVISSLTACESEKEFIFIDGDLPIKTKTLYMVGSATPTGWNIDSPTVLEPTEEDPLVFTWEGALIKGELKLCLTTGSWDAPFIRPLYDGDEIGKTDLSEAKFQMHAGDPDEKWHIIEAGNYHLTFDLRNWNMSTAYLGGMDAPSKEPIQTDVLYIVGDATPTGWNIDSPTILEKISDYIFEYEGELFAGELKACISLGSWDVPFIRPETEGVAIGKNGVENKEFIFVANPDNKWNVKDSGIYHLIFDLQNYTITAEYEGDIVNDKTPIETSTLYMLGDATPGGWSMDDLTAYTISSDNKYIFTWEGDLVTGNMKVCLEPDPTFSCPFIRPESANCKISSKGVEAEGFVYTQAPDDQWQITEVGTYRITFDLENWTIKVDCLSSPGSGQVEPDDGDEKDPLETTTLYMIGDATPGGWSMDKLTALTVSPDDEFVFTWTGSLTTGEMKACTQPDGTFSCPFLRPVSDGCVINESGVASSDFIYTTGPDTKWRIEKAGNYTISFNLKTWTIKADYLD